jgi:hypothetical protein
MQFLQISGRTAIQIGWYLFAIIGISGIIVIELVDKELFIAGVLFLIIQTE